jgi:hypothetical protein
MPWRAPGAEGGRNRQDRWRRTGASAACVSCRRVGPSRPLPAGSGRPRGYRKGALYAGAGFTPTPLGWSLESVSAVSSIVVPGAGRPTPPGCVHRRYITMLPSVHLSISLPIGDGPPDGYNHAPRPPGASRMPWQAAYPTPEHEASSPVSTTPTASSHRPCSSPGGPILVPTRSGFASRWSKSRGCKSCTRPSPTSSRSGTLTAMSGLRKGVWSKGCWRSAPRRHRLEAGGARMVAARLSTLSRRATIEV